MNTDGKRKAEVEEKMEKKRKVEEKLGLQWVLGEPHVQEKDDSDDSDSSWTTNSSSSSSSDEEESDAEEDKEKDEEKKEVKVGTSMDINTKYPKTNLKRWSTTKASTYIDTSAPSSYTNRLGAFLRKKQVTLPDVMSTLAMSPVTSSLN